MSDSKDLRKKNENLLRLYEPILRFSAGENFFPMKVDTFQENSKWVSSKNGRESDNYYQFVNRPLGTFRHLVGWVFYYGLVLVTTVSWLFYLFRMWPTQDADAAQASYLLFVAFGTTCVLLIWPLFSAHRPTYLAFLFVLLSIPLLGTPEGTLLGLIGVVIIGCVLLLFGILSFLYGPHRVHADQLYLARIGWLLWVGFGLLLVLGACIIPLATNMADAVYLQVIFLMAVSTLTWFLIIIPISRSLDGSRRQMLDWWLDLVGKPTDLEVKHGIFSKEHFRLLIPFLCSLIGFVFAISIDGTAGGVTGRAVSIVTGTWLLLFFLEIQWPLAYPFPYSHLPLTFIRKHFKDEQGRHFRKQLVWNRWIIGLIAIVLILWTFSSVIFPSLQPTSQMMAFNLLLIVNVVAIFLILGSNSISTLINFTSIHQSNTNADSAKMNYEELMKAQEKQNGSRYYYYGRVYGDDHWTALQYFYFYAFNDYRSTAEGLNNHEGDWEAVTIYVEAGEADLLQQGCVTKVAPKKPFAVAYSHHHEGKLCFQEQVEFAIDEDGKETFQPMVYVAKGSHANYPAPQITEIISLDTFPRLSNLDHKIRRFRRNQLKVVALSDEQMDKKLDSLALNLRRSIVIVENLFWGLNDEDISKLEKNIKSIKDIVPFSLQGEKNIQESIDDLRNKIAGGISQDEAQQMGQKLIHAINNAISEEDKCVIYILLHYESPPDSTIPIEYACGDGLRIGKEGKSTDIFASRNNTEYLISPWYPNYKEKKSCEGIKRTWEGEKSTWGMSAILPEDEELNSGHWLHYKGLWGRKSWLLKDESGPTGPRWERYDEEKNKQTERMRWGRSKVNDCPPRHHHDWKNRLLRDIVLNDSESLDCRLTAFKHLMGVGSSLVTTDEQMKEFIRILSK